MTLDIARVLLSSAERGRLVAGGREVGGLLATQPPPVVAALRREVDHAHRNAPDEFVRGFTEALEMVLAGFTRERDRTEQVAADVDLIRSRRHWREVLGALSREVVRPRAIAEQVGAPESSISKVLDGLELAGFIERADSDADRRARPRRLTLRARVALAHAQPEATAPVRTVVAGVVDCIASLADNHRESRHQLEARLARALGPTLAPVALDALVAALSDCALGELEPDDAVVVSGLEQQQLLDRCLRAALADDRELPRLTALAEVHPLVVRANDLRWDVLVARRNWPRIQVVRNDDLLQSSRALPAAFHVLYESPLLAVDDLRHGGRVLEQADRRLVLTPGVDRTPPPGFEPLDTLAVFEAAA